MADLFQLKISSTIYYSSLTEAITTFIVICIATLITIIIFIHTIYKFFCEPIPLNEFGEAPPATSGSSSSSPPSFGRGRSGSATRSKMPSLNRSSRSHSSQQYHAHHTKEIHIVIAALTIAYLLSASIYAFINWLIRLLMIFFEVTISCYALGYVQIAYVFVRISFYCLFTVRLYLSFIGSNLAIKPVYLIIICTLSSLLLIAAFIYFLFDVQYQYERAGNDCSQNANFNYIRPLLPAVIVDTIACVLLLYLFVNKLSQLIRIQTSSIDSFVSADQMAIDRIKNLIAVSTKLTVLVCVYIIGYWLLFLLFSPILPGAASMCDISIGTFCVIFCYEFHLANYDKYCFPCKWCCFHICFWWFIICKEESNAAQRFGVCDICCCLEAKSDDQKRHEQHVQTQTGEMQSNMSSNEVVLRVKTNNNTKGEKERDLNSEITRQEEQTRDNAQDTEDGDAANDGNIELMIANEIVPTASLQGQHSSDHEHENEHENVKEDDAHGAMPGINKVNSLSSEQMYGHEKTNTFVVNLNPENTAKIMQGDEHDEEDENGDGDNAGISRSQTNTFDFRAQRLRELHALFFGDTFKGSGKERRRRKNAPRSAHEEKKQQLMTNKRARSEFDVHRIEEGDEEDVSKKEHVVKKSKTAIL